MQLITVPMASSGGANIGFVLPLILIVGMIWFMSRTQKKQRQKQADTVAMLTPGTKVITTSGMVGIVEEVDDQYVTLEISEGVLIQLVKAAVGRVIPDDAEEPADEAADAEEPVAEEEPAVDEERETVDVPETGDKVQDKAKLPPTHTEN
jgi:preprotein translocase subunit YajC